MLALAVSKFEINFATLPANTSAECLHAMQGTCMWFNSELSQKLFSNHLSDAIGTVAAEFNRKLVVILGQFNLPKETIDQFDPEHITFDLHGYSNFAGAYNRIKENAFVSVPNKNDLSERYTLTQLPIPKGSELFS
jgi:hypothetical protein